MSGYLNHLSSDDIYDMLKKDILNLKLKPGQMISENEVALNCNVSRTPVKTAFLRLKGEKYIDIVPQRGSFVTLMDFKYIQDVIYMRWILEIDALDSIIDNDCVDKVVSVLKSNLEEQNRLIASNIVSPMTFFSIDSKFHFHLFETAGREKIWDVIQDCQLHYIRFCILDTSTTSRYNDLYCEHKEIVQRLEVKDKLGLRECLFKHLHGNIVVLTEKIKGEYKDYFI